MELRQIQKYVGLALQERILANAPSKVDPKEIISSRLTKQRLHQRPWSTRSIRRYAYGIVSRARWVYLSTSLRNLSRAFRRVKDRRRVLR